MCAPARIGGATAGREASPYSYYVRRRCKFGRINSLAYPVYWMTPKDTNDTVASIIDARRNMRPLARLAAGTKPLSLDDAYAVQEAFARVWDSPVVGYKIGCASKESQALVGASGPFTARIFKSCRFDSPAEILMRDFFVVGVEAEFGFSMRRDLSPQPSLPYGREQVASAVMEVAPVIEICDTRLADWKKSSIEEIIADNGFHGGLVVGSAVADWPNLDLAAHEVVISVDGSVRGSGASAGSIGDPLDGLVWLANDLSRRGYGLKAGDIIATGTWTGLHFVAPGATVVADYGTLGKVELNVRA